MTATFLSLADEHYIISTPDIRSNMPIHIALMTIIEMDDDDDDKG